MEREAALVDECAEGRVASRQRNGQLDPAPGVSRQGLAEAGQLHEAEALREGEVLVQQPVAAERAGRVRNQRLLAGKADRLDRLAPQPLEPRQRTRGWVHQHTEAAAADELVKLQRDLVPA